MIAFKSTHPFEQRFQVSAELAEVFDEEEVILGGRNAPQLVLVCVIAHSDRDQPCNSLKLLRLSANKRRI